MTVAEKYLATHDDLRANVFKGVAGWRRTPISRW
jgi:hypothetical protein